jgi:hypothetical protein
MSEYSPGSFVFADRIMDMYVEGARREVKAQRLASAARPDSQPFHCAVLASLGQRLAAWGATLQQRYNTEESTPTPARAG